MLKGLIITFLIRRKISNATSSDIITFEAARKVMILLNARDLDDFISSLQPELQVAIPEKKIGLVVFYPDKKYSPKPEIHHALTHLPVSPADFNLLGFPRKSLRQKMEGFQADLVLSLDTEHEKRLILASTFNQKAFRVGPGKADPLSGYDLSLSTNGDMSPARLFAEQCNYLESLNGKTNGS